MQNARMLKVRLNTSMAMAIARFCQHKNPSQPLRSLKPKSSKATSQNFVDFKSVQAFGGHGGNGCVSFLSLWANEFAGPDGGDGGNGGHVIFRSTGDANDLVHMPSVLRGEDGEKGGNKDCHGKCAQHTIVDVPVGTIIKNHGGIVVGDLHKEGLLFVVARGGAGGKGNHFFVTDTEQAPKIAQFGAKGEALKYTVELRSIAHLGLIGLPNVGKSTLLRAISRARPKVAPYPFTTLKPHIGMVQYDDYEQIAVADLPGLIEDSHKNKGLGIQFLRHVERCKALLFIVDMSLADPWLQLDVLHHELSKFNENLNGRPQLVIANKIDVLEDVEQSLAEFAKRTESQVIPISAKTGKNLNWLLVEVKKLVDASS